MSSYPLIGMLVGFGLTFGLIRFLAPFAERLGLVDHPGGRKRHVVRTPTVGGIAIVAGLLLTALLTGFAGKVHPAFWTGLIALALAGTVDDRHDLGPLIKLAVQIAVALMMSYWGGLTLFSLGNLITDEPLALGRFALPLTVFAVIGIVNSINLSDGADGLAGGLVFISVFWIAFMSAVLARTDMHALTFGILGCIAAFLAFNLRFPWRTRATIFLGDAGSLSLGFAVAWLTVDATQEGSRLFAPVTAIWLVAIPISDTIVCMCRRLLRGQSPFRADRTHLHHILIDLGMPVARAVALIHLLAFVLAGVGVAGWALRAPEYYMFYAAMAVFTAYIVLAQYGLQRVSASAHGLGLSGRR